MTRRNQIALTLGGAALGLAAVFALWLTRGPAPEPAAAVVHDPALGDKVRDAYRASVLDGASPELAGALKKPGESNDLPPIDPNLRTAGGTMESTDPALPPLPNVPPALPGAPTPVSKGTPAELPSLPPLPPLMPKAD